MFSNISNSYMQISVNNLSFHADIGYHFEICKNVVDCIFKNFSQVVDNQIKGLHAVSTIDMCIHYIFARPLGTIYFKLKIDGA
jgi:hypothetical protein